MWMNEFAMELTWPETASHRETEWSEGIGRIQSFNMLKKKKSEMYWECHSTSGTSAWSPE